MSLNSIIEAQVAAHNTAAAELTAQIAELQAQLDWHKAEAARHSESIAPKAVKLTELPPKMDIVWANTDDGVELHSPKCKDLRKHVMDPLTEVSKPEQWRSAQEFFNDYNADFYDEGGDDACWNVTAFSCTGWKKETITTMAN